MEEQHEVQQSVVNNQPLPPSTKEQKKTPLIVIGGLFFIILLGFIGWFILQQYSTTDKAPQKQTEQLYKGKIVIGYTIWPGYLGLYIAQDKGYFKEAGLDVELKRYIGFAALSEAFKKGEIQGQATLTYDAVQAAYNGVPNKAVIVVDYSNGSDGIIAGPTITSLAQAKGKRMGFEYGTMGEFFARYALEQYNMTVADIVPVDLESEQAALALAKGEIDIATTFEPFMTKTVEEINGHKLYTSADAPGVITDIITFQEDFVKQNPATIQALVTTYFRGLDFWKEHPEEANRIIAKELEVTPEEAKEQLGGITILDKRDNIAAFTFAVGLKSLYGNMKQVSLSIQNQATTSAIIDTDSLIEPKYIKALAQ